MLCFCFRYKARGRQRSLSHEKTKLVVVVCHLRLALTMTVEMTRSRNFLRSFLVWATDSKIRMQRYVGQSEVSVESGRAIGQDGVGEMKIEVQLCCPNPNGQEARITDAEIRWGKRIMALVVTRLQLETVFAWLSTLGGAYSSLGEKFVEHARVAGVISKKQLALALQLGDPILSAQCKLYYALSLMQQGRLEAAAAIVRQQTKISKTGSFLEKRFQTMCKACRERLQFYSTKRSSTV